MNCEEFKKSFYGYLEGQIDLAARESFEAHKTECIACGELYQVGTELTCREFVEFLDDYVEDRMTPERRAEFERHVSVCPDCVAFVDSYRRTMALTKAALRGPETSVHDSLPEQLVRSILSARRRQG